MMLTTYDDPPRFEKAHGFPLVAARHPELGTWNGYIGVPEGHPLFGASYRDIEVHGGLTYAGDRVPAGMSNGSPAEVFAGHWWFGFDCAHAGDLIPQIEELREPLSLGPPHEGDTFKDADWVLVELQSLAYQLRDL